MSQASEAALWSAMRALEEKAALQRRTATAMSGNVKMRERLLDQATADAHNAQLIRGMIFGRDAELERRNA